jgi:hypothetical protein
MHEAVEEKTIYHKNMKKVTYVTAGRGRHRGKSRLCHSENEIGHWPGLPLAEGYELKTVLYQPAVAGRSLFDEMGRRNGTVPNEVFRDLGIAFAVVSSSHLYSGCRMVLKFCDPLVHYAPIPLTLVGILPGHWVFGAFFRQRPLNRFFIAWPALLSVYSILLVDFIQMEWEQKGDLRQALIQAGPCASGRLF